MAVAQVQNNFHRGSGSFGSGATGTVTLSGVGAGNLLTVSIVTWSGQTVSSVTDNHSQTWHQLQTANGAGSGPGSGHMEFWYRENVAAGSYTVTVNLSGSDNYSGYVLSEFSGCDTVTPIDVSTATTQSGTTPSATITTTVDGDMLYISTWINPAATGSNFSGYNARQSVPDSFNGSSIFQVFDLVQGAHGSTTATSTAGSVTSGAMVFASFKPAAVAATNHNRLGMMGCGT